MFPVLSASHVIVSVFHSWLLELETFALLFRFAGSLQVGFYSIVKYDNVHLSRAYQRP